MPNDTAPVNATGLPTRRRALASLAGLGAALSLPLAAKAAAAAARPDAALIAHAAMVAELIARYQAAWERQIDLDDKVGEMMPQRPKAPVGNDPIDKVERAADGTLLSIHFGPADPTAVAAEKQHEAAVAEWESACAALKEEMALTAAEELASDLYGALGDAVEELTAMTPTTLSGLTAKARIAIALDPHQDFELNAWEHALIASVARDAAAIGGAA